MSRFRAWVPTACACLLGGVLVSCGGAFEATTTSPRLVWADEFDGVDLDSTRWERQIGDGCPRLCGWGNNELQVYQRENVYLEQGNLIIEALESAAPNAPYTSARIRSKNRGDWKYGRIVARARLPEGQGIWPAIWMLPTDNAYGGWPRSGEIDIMELVGHDPSTVHGTLHYGGPHPRNESTTGSFSLPEGRFSDGFHVFTLEWEREAFRWFVDDSLYQTVTRWNSEGASYPAPFDQRFHLVLNIAVGGNWPGAPDSATRFPQRMEVDYVRVYASEGE